MELKLSKYNLNIEYTDLSPTYHNGDNHTTIDLTLSNDYTPKIQNWKLLKGKSHSDHELIQFEIKIRKDKNKKKNKYNNRKIQYKDIFKTNLEKEINKMDQPLENVFNKINKKQLSKKSINRLTNVILQALKNTPKQN